MAADVTSGITTYSGSLYNRSPVYNASDDGKPRFKVGYLTAPDTTDATDTISVDVYAQFGITKVLAVMEFVHTTTDSVVAEETLVTTAVTGTTLTVTVPAGTDNDKRVIVVYGI
jgi:hypothetical protein